MKTPPEGTRFGGAAGRPDRSACKKACFAEVKMQDNILEVRHLSKYYAGVKALDDVSIAFRRGEVHALAGEKTARASPH